MSVLFSKPASLVVVALALLMVAVSIGCAEPPADASTRFSAESNKGQAYVTDNVSNPNILQIALNSADHTTLVAAVQAAELENVLVNAGPLTVFAPTNAAFDALPDGTLDELLEPENKSRLAKIITSHAAPGTFKGNLLKDGTQVYQATGHFVRVEVRDGDTYVNGARILGTVDATNGVVHVIDQVLLMAAE